MNPAAPDSNPTNKRRLDAAFIALSVCRESLAATRQVLAGQINKQINRRLTRFVRVTIIQSVNRGLPISQGTLNNTVANTGNKMADINFDCPHCGHNLEVSERGAGLTVACPECSKNIQIPIPALEHLMGNIIFNECGLPRTGAKRLRALFVVLISLGVIAATASYIWFSMSRARPLPPMQNLETTVPAKTKLLNLETTVPAKAKLPMLESTEFFSSKELAKALQEFVAYKNALLEGRFSQASSKLLQIKALLQDVQEETNFWQEVEDKVGKVTTLQLYYLCPQCKGKEPEKCDLCMGNGTCTTCKGGKVCSECKGKDSRSTKICEKCANSFCLSCRGTGLCGKCQGYGEANCPTCRGVGNLLVETPDTCRSCGGKGEKPGIASPIRCYYCGGTGRGVKSKHEKCTDCGGKSRIRCGLCQGGKKCLTCGATGKLLLTNCTVCGGKRTIDVFCGKCLGSGKCKDCEGRGNCRKCAKMGHLQCGSCSSSGLVHFMNLPVAYEWLSVTNGYWNSSGHELREVLVDGVEKVQLSDRQVKVMFETGITADGVVVIYETNPAGNYGIFKN